MQFKKDNNLLAMIVSTRFTLLLASFRLVVVHILDLPRRSLEIRTGRDRFLRTLDGGNSGNLSLGPTHSVLEPAGRASQSSLQATRRAGKPEL